MDVDGTSGNINLLLAGRSSSYLSTSPYYPSSTGRTTLLPDTATGRHNPNANAEATIQYLDTTSAGQGVRANFTLYNVGNIENGLDEAGLALKYSQVNIDRGTNTTSAGSSPDQFLEIAPSETSEGGLRVDFLGTDASGTAWSNPVYAFGFYLLGREAKRDVYLDVRDIYGNLIHSSVTTEGEIVTPTTSVEYITFQVDANENPVGSFELREEYNGEDVIWRDIFSVDDLSLYTGLTYSGWKPVMTKSRAVPRLRRLQMLIIRMQKVGAIALLDPSGQNQKKQSHSSHITDGWMSMTRPVP